MADILAFRPKSTSTNAGLCSFEERWEVTRQMENQGEAFKANASARQCKIVALFYDDLAAQMLNGDQEMALYAFNQAKEWRQRASERDRTVMHFHEGLPATIC